MTFEQYFLEKRDRLKEYSIQTPPTTKKECIRICKKTSMAEDPWTKNVNGKDVDISFEEAAKSWDLATARHEALHALQELNIPNIMKGLPKLSHKFDSPEEYKKKHYYNRPPEIMAYAYDTVMGVNSAKNKKIYKDIGGEVYDLFQHYISEYKK